MCNFCKRSDETERSVTVKMLGILGFQSILPAWINDSCAVPGKTDVIYSLSTDGITEV